MSADWENKPVGYKDPPRWTQFQKGRSGNPRGRPRKHKTIAAPDPANSSALDDALRKERERIVKVNEGKGSKDFAMYEVVCRSLVNNAAKGDVRAQREILKLWSSLEARDAQRQEEEERIRRLVIEKILAMKERQVSKWAEVEGTKTEPADPWPHPDDIFVNTDTGYWHVRGPMDDKDLPLFEHCRALRDVLFTRLALDIRQGKLGTTSVGTLWVFCDAMLPKRWQIGDNLADAFTLFMMLPLRDLREFEQTYIRRAEQLKSLSHDGPMDKQTYRLMNNAMKPLLQRHGFRSLTEFEKAYEQSGGAMSQPKGKTIDQGSAVP